MGIMDEIDELAEQFDGPVTDDVCELCFCEDWDHEATCPLSPEVNMIDEEYDYAEDCE